MTVGRTVPAGSSHHDFSASTASLAPHMQFPAGAFSCRKESRAAKTVFPAGYQGLSFLLLPRQDTSELAMTEGERGAICTQFSTWQGARLGLDIPTPRLVFVCALGLVSVLLMALGRSSKVTWLQRRGCTGSEARCKAGGGSGPQNSEHPGRPTGVTSPLSSPIPFPASNCHSLIAETSHPCLLGEMEGKRTP